MNCIANCYIVNLFVPVFTQSIPEVMTSVSCFFNRMLEQIFFSHVMIKKNILYFSVLLDHCSTSIIIIKFDKKTAFVYRFTDISGGLSDEILHLLRFSIRLLHGLYQKMQREKLYNFYRTTYFNLGQAKQSFSLYRKI